MGIRYSSLDEDKFLSCFFTEELSFPFFFFFAVFIAVKGYLGIRCCSISFWLKLEKQARFLASKFVLNIKFG